MEPEGPENGGGEHLTERQRDRVAAEGRLGARLRR
jgi:hypothetical protein